MSRATDRRRRLLDAVGRVPQLERFAAATAGLLAIDEQAALDALDAGMAGAAPLLPNIEARSLPCGRPGHLALLVRVRHGTAIPDHEHFGTERSLILQGRCTDEPAGVEYGPGDELEKAAQTHHRIDVLDGPDLLFVTVVEHGFAMGSVVVGRRAP